MGLKLLIKFAPILPIIIGDVKDLVDELSDDEPTKKQALDALDGVLRILGDLRTALDK